MDTRTGRYMADGIGIRFFRRCQSMELESFISMQPAQLGDMCITFISSDSVTDIMDKLSGVNQSPSTWVRPIKD